MRLMFVCNTFKIVIMSNRKYYETHIIRVLLICKMSSHVHKMTNDIFLMRSVWGDVKKIKDIYIWYDCMKKCYECKLSMHFHRIERKRASAMAKIWSMIIYKSQNFQKLKWTEIWIIIDNVLNYYLSYFGLHCYLVDKLLSILYYSWWKITRICMFIFACLYILHFDLHFERVLEKWCLNIYTCLSCTWWEFMYIQCPC